MTQQQIPDIVAMYEAAASNLRKVLAGVADSTHGNSTPCSDWDVKALMNHILKSPGFVEGHILANNTVDPSDVNGPLPAEGPLAFFDAGVTRVLDLAKAPGTLDKKIDTPLGTRMVREFLMFPILDMTVHSWDLAGDRDRP